MTDQHINKFIKTFKFAAFNVDGLYQHVGCSRQSKLDDDHLKKSLSNHDIFFLLETHCGPDLNHDKIELDGFLFDRTWRAKPPGARKYSGGIAVGVKKHFILSKAIEILPSLSKSPEIIWAKLKKSFFNLDNDL